MRMTPTRCIVVTALCLFWPTLSHAQRSAPTAADVRARLHSRNAAEVAWAAFDAATYQMREVAPDLIAVDLGYLTAEETNSLPLALDTEIHDRRGNTNRPIQ
jgi:hypothetical protein